MNTQHDHEDADVLIVGAGASGGVAALELASRGFRVVCLEQGDWALPDDFTGGKPEWELTRLKQWHPSPNVRGRKSDYPVDTKESPIEPLMFNGVGGSTILFSGHWVRAMPSDFRVRTLDGVADDWPFTYEDLRPFYDEVTHHIGASGLEGDPAYPDAHTFPLPPMPIGKYGLAAAKGMDKLGWHWWPAPNAIASRKFKNRPACQRYGACESGCPTGAKASTDFTHWRDAIAAGAVLVTGARVRQLTVDNRGLVTGAEYVDRAGVVRHQAAGVTVLAANGIGTPRLLLNSASAQFPDGLANSSGLVGKRLMVHPYASVYGAYENELETWLGPTGQALQSMQFYETDTSRGFVRGAKWNLMPTGGPLTHTLWEPGENWRDAFGSAFHPGGSRPSAGTPSGGSPPMTCPRSTTRSSCIRTRWTPMASRCPGFATPSARTRNACSSSTSTGRSRPIWPRARPRCTPSPLSGKAAGTSWAPRAWAPIPPLPSSTSTGERTTCRTFSSLTGACSSPRPASTRPRPSWPSRCGRCATSPKTATTSPLPTEDLVMLETEQRRTFAALIDVLIPASDRMPSATAAGVADALLDQVLGYRPDLAEPFAEAVAQCTGKDPEAALDALAEQQPEQFQALTLLTAGAYFLSPQVKAALAYDPPPRTVNDDVDSYIDMLADVVDRGFTIR